MATDLQTIDIRRTDVMLADSSTSSIIGTFDYEHALANITEEQKEYCRKLTKDINTDNPHSIQKYAQESNNIVSRNANELLERQTASKNNESLLKLNEFVSDIQEFELRGEEQTPVSGFKRFLKSLPVVGSFVKDIERASIKRKTVGNNVQEVQKKFEAIKVVAISDNNSLEEMGRNAVEYINDIREKIVALMLLRDQLQEEVAAMEASDVCDLNVLQVKRNSLAAMNRRITDMSTNEYLIQQSVVQISGMIANNDNVIQLADQTISQAIPMLKYQLAIDLMGDDTKLASDTSQKFREISNQIARSNAKKLNMTTVAITKQSSEPFFDVKTIHDTTHSIIDTINQIRDIRNNSEAKQKEIIAEIKQCGTELADALKSVK